MRRLQDLPFDVLHQIWQLVSPYDFEACALTCKFLHASAEPLLQRHNALRKQYRRIRLPERSTAAGVDDTSLEPYTLPQLLCDIAADPVIAEYIVHVDLEHREALNRVYEYDENGRETVVRAKMEARSEPLWQLMRQSPYFAQLKVAPSRIRDWFNCILLESADFDDGQCIDFAAAFLLSLLPNLQSLALSRDWMLVTVRPDPDGNDVYYSDEEDEDEDEDNDGEGGKAVKLAKKTAPLVRKFIHYMIELANREDLAGQPLSKLHTLHPTWAVDTQFGDNIASIFPFLTLKSLRRVFHDFGTLDADDFPSEASNSDNMSEADGDNDGMSNEERASEGPDDDDDDALDEDEEDDDDDDEGASQNDQDGDASEDGELEEEHGEGSDAEADHVEDEWRSAESGPRRYDALGATVEHMTLDSCAISPRGCRLFFSNMERLITLQYRHHTMESFGREWDADAFVQSLACTPASLSLEKLALLAGMVWDDGLPIRSALHGFRSLRHLEVDGVFFGHNPNWTGATPALHGLLPASLRTFVLHISTENYDCVEDLFQGFRDERSERLPLLEGVELRVRDVDFMGCPVEEHQECLEKIQSTAELHGLSVTVVSSEEHFAYQMT